MRIRTLRQIKGLENKVVLLRVDFNVPYKEGKIEDDFKMISSLDTIEYLIKHKAKVLILTHFGRPEGRDGKYSVKPLAVHLKSLLNKPKHSRVQVKFVSDTIGEKVKKSVSKLKPGNILFLENVRFYKQEKDNDQEFARQLASLADVYVNDAFANSHRAHASMDAIKEYLKPYAGLLLEKEIRNMSDIDRNGLVVILGGVKTTTKIPLIQRFYGEYSKILLGGALANNFLLNKGMEIGKSLIDKDSLIEIRKLKKKNIIIPRDVVVSSPSSQTRVCSVSSLKKKEAIFDIGPDTITLYAKYIKEAKTIIWNGPLGMFEDKQFRMGTLAIARLVAARSRGRAFGIVGGGETVEALKMSKMGEYVDFISSGGGAMLSYLGNKEMPGLTGIVIKK